LREIQLVVIKKYFPEIYGDPDGNKKFLELKRGTRTVAEYEAKFSELSRFVPEL
jgi:hypothetical protein